MCCKSHLQTNLKKGKDFTAKKEISFLMSCCSFQTRKDLVLVKFYYNATVQRFLKTFRKFAGKRLRWKPKPFLGKFKLFKMDSDKSFFLSAFRTPFYGRLKTLNRNGFLWMITLFGTNTPESSKICQKKEGLLNAPKYLGARLFYSLYAQMLHIFWNVFLSKKRKKKKRKEK